MKIKNKNLSTRFKLLLLSGAFVLTSTGFSGCIGKNDSNESQTEVVIENEATNSVASDNKVYYDEITTLEKDIVEFCEDSLPNGFIEVNDSNKQEMAELFTNSYIQLNSSVLETKTIAVLDQDLELIPSDISNDFMEFSTCVGRYYQVATPETVLEFDKLIKDENDLEFITNLSNKIAEMNDCKDNQSRQEKINEIVEIKESLLTNPNIAIDYNSETLYLATKMIIYSDATAKAYGYEIITSEEEQIQLYSSFYDVYCDTVVSSGYIETEEVIDREVVSQTSFESKYLSTSTSVMESIINKVSNYEEEFDNSYSYGNVTLRISEKISTMYEKPEQTVVEVENEIRQQTSDYIDAQTIGTTVQTEVPVSEVPVQNQIADKIEITDDKNNLSTEGYIEGLAYGRTVGSDAAWQRQMSTGTIPSTISISQVGAPSGNNSSEYISGYKEGYVEGWNNYVASAKASQSTPVTEFESVENGKEDIIFESEPEKIIYEEEETEFIPIDGEEIEISSQMTKLIELKNEILSTYAYAYDNTIEEGVKKM